MGSGSKMDGGQFAMIISTAITATATVIVAYLTHSNKKTQAEANDTANRLSVSQARATIAHIYDDHKQTREIDEQVWASVEDLYTAYKSTTVDGHVPNSWCDSIVKEMRTWKKI